MQAARLTQDHYGYFRQPFLDRKRTGKGNTEVSRARHSIVPTERLVEGKLLRNGRSSPDVSLERVPAGGRFFNSSVYYPDTTLTAQAAQRAIKAYLDNAATPGLSGKASYLHSVDYYVLRVLFSLASKATSFYSCGTSVM